MHDLKTRVHILVQKLASRLKLYQKVQRRRMPRVAKCLRSIVPNAPWSSHNFAGKDQSPVRSCTSALSSNRLTTGIFFPGMDVLHAVHAIAMPEHHISRHDLWNGDHGLVKHHMWMQLRCRVWSSESAVWTRIDSGKVSERDI